MSEETSIDNVILLGAGASFDAGIPLLGNFVEVMNRMVLTGRSHRGALTDEDKDCLVKAMNITHKLEPYHARVAIDQFNLEQVLSVLAFESYTGSKQGKTDLADFTQAIAKTIELTCTVTHDGVLDTHHLDGPEVYRKFWRSLFLLLAQRMEHLPTILTFNYDLVLERALFQFLIGPQSFEYLSRCRHSGISLDYQHSNCPEANYRFERAHWRAGRLSGNQEQTGFLLKPEEGPATEDFAQIRLLKLHGSLNFPTKKRSEDWSPVKPEPSPWIIPPVFNKAEGTFASDIWKDSLKALRSCKQLIVCGYSLPTTDTYMQYFLKAALGPNRNLQNILVFDPELFKQGENGKELRRRYKECFSQHMQNRINFQPQYDETHNSSPPGTFAHMADLIHQKESLLFGVTPA